MKMVKLKWAMAANIHIINNGIIMCGILPNWYIWGNVLCIALSRWINGCPCRRLAGKL